LERKEGGYFVSDEELRTGLKVAAFISIGVMVLRTVFWPIVIVKTIK